MITTNTREQELVLLKSKIEELQSALFFTESVSLIKLPTHVISDVEIDNEGDIWFVIPKPMQHIEAFDKEIPAKLDFFKKGMDFFVKVRGTAYLITDASEMIGLSAEMQEKMASGELIGVKVKVQQTEMVDNAPKPAQNWLQASRSQLSSWFF